MVNTVNRILKVFADDELFEEGVELIGSWCFHLTFIKYIVFYLKYEYPLIKNELPQIRLLICKSICGDSFQISGNSC